MTEIATNTAPTTATPAAMNWDAFFEQRSDRSVKYYVLKIFLDGLMDAIKSIIRDVERLDRLVDGKNVRTLELRVLGFEARVAATESRTAHLEHDVNTSKAATSTGTDAALLRRALERIDVLEKRDAERESLVLSQGQLIAELLAKAKGMFAYKQVWDSSKTYNVGEAVTQGGSIWHSNIDGNKTVPGSSEAWTLACKRGRDGKDLR